MGFFDNVGATPEAITIEEIKEKIKAGQKFEFSYYKSLIKDNDGEDYKSKYDDLIIMLDKKEPELHIRECIINDIIQFPRVSKVIKDIKGNVNDAVGDCEFKDCVVETINEKFSRYLVPNKKKGTNNLYGYYIEYVISIHNTIPIIISNAKTKEYDCKIDALGMYVFSTEKRDFREIHLFYDSIKRFAIQLHKEFQKIGKNHSKESILKNLICIVLLHEFAHALMDEGCYKMYKTQPDFENFIEEPLADAFAYYVLSKTRDAEIKQIAEYVIAKSPFPYNMGMNIINECKLHSKSHSSYDVTKMIHNLKRTKALFS